MGAHRKAEIIRLIEPLEEKCGVRSPNDVSSKGKGNYQKGGRFFRVKVTHEVRP